MQKLWRFTAFVILSSTILIIIVPISYASGNSPNYRNLFTSKVDGAYAEQLGWELREAFEQNPVEFIQRLSIYKVNYQAQTIKRNL